MLQIHKTLFNLKIRVIGLHTKIQMLRVKWHNPFRNVIIAMSLLPSQLAKIKIKAHFLPNIRTFYYKNMKEQTTYANYSRFVHKFWPFYKLSKEVFKVLMSTDETFTLLHVVVD